VKGGQWGIPSPGGACRLSHRAMATLYEVLIADEDPSFAEQAAQAMFEELDRLEAELSRYLPNSDIARVNNLSPHQETRVGIDAFEALRLSKQYWASTFGAFDATVGSLMDCLVGKGRTPLDPSPDELERARRACGMNLIELDEATFTVRVLEPAPRIDLGAVGKGYAVDRAVELLKEWGVGSALVHGGRSSVYAYGPLEGEPGWPVTMSDPARPEALLERIVLCDRALSGSGVQRGRHIVDPRTGRVAASCKAAWVCSLSAAESDALSTACMVMDTEEIRRYQARYPDTWVMVLPEGGENSLSRVLKLGALPVCRTPSA
jgi:thiamine biosynthesis lipoprotein